jgi:hypothetical protein
VPAAETLDHAIKRLGNARPCAEGACHETRIAMAMILASVVFSTAAQPEQKFQRLTAGQIRAKFAGMELTDEVHWRELYARNGTVASY